MDPNDQSNKSGVNPMHTNANTNDNANANTIIAANANPSSTVSSGSLGLPFNPARDLDSYLQSLQHNAQPNQTIAERVDEMVSVASEDPRDQRESSVGVELNRVDVSEQNDSNPRQNRSNPRQNRSMPRHNGYNELRRSSVPIPFFLRFGINPARRGTFLTRRIPHFGRDGEAGRVSQSERSFWEAFRMIEQRMLEQLRSELPPTDAALIRRKRLIREHTQLFTYQSHQVKRGQPKDAKNPDKCVICLSEIQPNQRLRRLKCFHVYHSNCISKWLQEKDTCPTCRTRFNVKDVDVADESNSAINENANQNNDADQPNNAPYDPADAINEEDNANNS